MLPREVVAEAEPRVVVVAEPGRQGC
jgi:hypothetical protein